MAPTGQYAIGAGVILLFTFTNRAGELADPSSATFYVRNPDTEAVTEHALVTATRESIGAYSIEVIPDVEGSWYYRGVGDGDLRCASLDTYFVVKGTVLA